MTGRQRTIPVNLKHEAEIQTDVNLLATRAGFDQSLIQTSRFKFQELAQERGFQSFLGEDVTLFEILQAIRELHKEGAHPVAFQKRIQHLQTNIEAILKRNLLIYDFGYEKEGKDYYSILNKKEKQLLEEEFKNQSFTTKLIRQETRIKELEDEIVRLRSSLKSFQNIHTETQIYRDLFLNLEAMLKDQKKKSIDFESFIEKKVSVAVKSASEQVANIGKGFVNSKFELKGIALAWIRDIQTLMNQDQWNLQTLEVKAQNFMMGLSNTLKKQELEMNRRIKQNYSRLQDNYSNFIALVKSKVQGVQSKNSQETILELRKYLRTINLKQGHLQSFKDVLFIGNMEPITVTQHVQDIRTKHIISLLSMQFKKLLTKYPKINEEITHGLRQLLSLEVLDQLIQTDSLERIKSILVYKEDIIKVQNVYNYSRQQDKKLIGSLRILIKSLLEELQRIKKESGALIMLDQGILQMLRAQALLGFDVEKILAFYRPQPKIVTVDLIVDRPVYFHDQLKKEVPVAIEKVIPIENLKERAVQVIKQVPFFIQVPKEITNYIYDQVQINSEVAVSVPCRTDVIVQRILQNEVLKQKIRQKLAVSYEEIIRPIQEIRNVVQKQKFEVIRDVPREVVRQEYKEVDVHIQVPVYMPPSTVERVKEIQLIREVLVEKIKNVEVQVQVPYVVNHPEIKYYEKHLPVYITNTTEQIVVVPQIKKEYLRDVVHEVEIQEKVVHVQKEVIREIPKEIFIENTHFVKGDIVQVLTEVPTIIEKPIINERLVHVDKEIQRIIPLYIREQKLVKVQVNVPYEKIVPQIIQIQVVKPVILREQIIRQVRVEVPVPIYIEREIIKEVKVIQQKVVQKIVQVPRVVQVQRIVEKIVVVPRIIDRIISVPCIVQKIVPLQQSILEIVEVPRQISVIQEKETMVQVDIVKERVVVVENTNFVDVEKIVQIAVETQVIKEVEKKVFIPQQVIKEIPVNVYRDRVVEKVVQVHEITVKDREVQIPFTFEKPVYLVAEKIVQTKNWTHNKQVHESTVQKIVCVTNVQKIPFEVQVIQYVPEIKEQAVQVIRQKVIYAQTIKQVQIIKEKIIELIVEPPRPKPEIKYLTKEKVVYVNNQKLQPVDVNSFYPESVLYEVQKPVNYIHYKEIPVQIPVLQQYETRTIVQSIKPVEISHDKLIPVKSNQIIYVDKKDSVRTQIINREVAKNLIQQKAIHDTTIHYEQIPSQPIVLEKTITNVREVQVKYDVEKIVEKIVMLPQIVEIVKTIHEITEKETVGVASDISLEAHRLNYIQNATELRNGLKELFASLKNNRQPQVRALLTIIEKFLPVIDSWISFPKIIQVPKYIQTFVEKDKPIIVPSFNKERQAALSGLIQMLIAQLIRIGRDHNIDIRHNLPQDLKILFFNQISGDNQLNEKLNKYILESKKRYESLGSWASQNLTIVNSFLQDRFTFSSMIDEFVHYKKIMLEENRRLQRLVDETVLNITSLECDKKKVLSDYQELVNYLSNHTFNEEEELRQVLKDHTQVLNPQVYFSPSTAFETINMVTSNLYRSSLNTLNTPFKQQNQASRIKPGDQDVQKLIYQLNQLERQKNSSERKCLNLQSELKDTKDDFYRKTVNLQREAENLREKANRQTMQRLYTKEKDGQEISQIHKMEELRKKREQEYEKRIREVEESHRRQIQNLKQELLRQETLRQESVKSSSTPGRRQSENLQMVRQNRRMQEKVKLLEMQIERLRRQSQAEQSERFVQVTGQVGSKRFQRPPKQFKTPGVEEYQKERVERVEHEEEQEVRSSSSRQSSPAFEGTWKSSMTLKVFMEHEPAEELVTIVMLKVIDAMQEELDRQNINSYSPQNIYLKNFNINNLESMFVKFGAPILNKKNRKDGCYISPEVHDNNPPTQKSIVWSLGVIWDQLVHREVFFKSIAQVQDHQLQYEVRNTRLSPILKNNLIDMLEKDPTKRIDLAEAKKRLSLQTYLTGRSPATRTFPTR